MNTLDPDLALYRSAYRRNGARVEPIPGADHRSAGRALQRLIDRFQPLARSAQASFPRIDPATVDSIYMAVLWRDLLDPHAGERSLARFIRTALHHDLLDEIERSVYHHEVADPFDESSPLDCPTPDHADAFDDMLDASRNLAPILSTIRDLAPDERVAEVLVFRRLAPAAEGAPRSRSIDDVAGEFGLTRGVARGLCRRADDLLADAIKTTRIPA